MLWGRDTDVVLRAENLTKFYGPRRGIEGLDLTVTGGEVAAFLGPNGAGKTTTIRLLLDCLRPTRGRVTVLGMDPRRDKELLHRQVATCPVSSPSPAVSGPPTCCGSSPTSAAAWRGGGLPGSRNGWSWT